MRNIYGHDRDRCADCARQRAKWGPTDHCGRTHELIVGDEVRIGKGKTVYEVVSVLPEFVYLERLAVRERLRRDPLARRPAWVSIGKGKKVWGKGHKLIDRDISCLTLVENSPHYKEEQE